MSQTPAWAGTRRYLLPDERAAIETRRHWMILLAPVLKSLVALGIATFLLAGDRAASGVSDIAVLLIVVILGYLAYQILQWWLDHFIVTDRRVLLVSGVLTKKTAVMPLMKVTDLTYEQNPMGRLLSYGTFIFESAGQDQALSRVSHLPGGPRQIYKQISELLFNYSGLAMRSQSGYTQQRTVDVRSGRPVGEESMRRHSTSPIPRLNPRWPGED